MLPRRRKPLLFSAAGITIASITAWLLVTIIWGHNERERKIEAVIAQASAKTYQYQYVWGKLVDKHGSQDAALVALREWAEAVVDYWEMHSRWKRGEAPRPDPDYPPALLYLSKSEVERLKEANIGVPYGCGYKNPLGGTIVWW